MDTVGFIGLGKMGVGMAGNIQKAGYPMVVYDVREAATKPLLGRGSAPSQFSCPGCQPQRRALYVCADAQRHRASGDRQ